MSELSLFIPVLGSDIELDVVYTYTPATSDYLNGNNWEQGEDEFLEIDSITYEGNNVDFLPLDWKTLIIKEHNS